MNIAIARPRALAAMLVAATLGAAAVAMPAQAAAIGTKHAGAIGTEHAGAIGTEHAGAIGTKYASAATGTKDVEAAILKGANETAGGDTDAFGVGIFGIDTASGEICYLFAHVNLDTVVAAHIHRGAAGTNGPVVVPFAAPTEHITKACTTAAPALAAEIAANPSGFYANIHTTAFPGGAIRGQLGP